MAVTNPYYEFDPPFVPGTKARSEDVNIQYQNLQNAFDLLPGSADAITTGTATFAPESGSGNAYVVTMPDTRTGEQDGDEVVFFSTHANTGAATLNVDGLGAKAIVNHEGNPLVANDILNGIAYVVRYDATNTRYQLVSPSAAYQTSAAASAAAALVSETNAAASAAEAQQWAVHPEDDDVDGYPGQFSAFHWAQKAQAAATIQRILTDINTATPPTTEAVTGLLEYYDADETDQLAYVGFAGSNTFNIRNQMHGGVIAFVQEDGAGSPGSFTWDGSQLLLPSEDDAVTPTLAFGDGDTGFYELNDDTLRGSIGGTEYFQWFVNATNGQFTGVNSGSFHTTNVSASRTVAPLGPRRSTGMGLGSFDSEEMSLIVQSTEFLRLVEKPTTDYIMAQFPFMVAEAANATTDIAGYGQFWVRNDTPNTPMFTDDAGNDYVLNSQGLDPDGTEVISGDWVFTNNTGVTGTESALRRDFLYIDGKEALDGADSFLRLNQNNDFTSGVYTPGPFRVDNTVSIYNTTSAQVATISVDTGGPDLRFNGGSVIDEIYFLAYNGTFRIQSGLTMVEQAAADTDLTGWGQIWVNSSDSELYFTGDDGVDKQITGVSQTLGGLSDVDLTGAANNDLLYRSGGNWVDTAGNLTWDGSTFVVTGTIRGANAEAGAILNQAATNVVPTLVPNRADVNTGFGSNAGEQISAICNGVEIMRIVDSGVNEYAQIFGTLFIAEQSAAHTDIAGSGQIWVRNGTPNELWFTDDAGSDFPVATGVARRLATNASYDLNTAGNEGYNGVCFYDNGTAYTITLENSGSEVAMPLDASFQIISAGTGTITINEGTTTTLYLIEPDGTIVDTAGGCTMTGGGGAATVYRSAAGVYYIWGSGLTA